ncbi:hypothetical protein VKT23_005628 [Stygiomarasmius scandens]|uniref:Uncharacterized protein n=1 Tax=Marasmiellus scandens TaxID=2682957 RepID=A0ABR1JSW6_9AGAR
MSVVRPLARNQLCCTRRAYFHALSTHFFSTTPGKSSTSRSKTPRRLSHDVASSTSPKQTSPVNLFHESKLQAYLDSISESQDTLTLEDLTRLKPAKHSPPLSPAYEAEYHQVLEKLQRSFTKGQLMYFLDLYPGAGKPGKYDRTKSGYAAHIIEQAWRWPAIGEVRKTKRDLSEVEIRTFPLEPRQSFMLLGRDGSRLLSLSKKYQVHISFSAKPLALKAEGLRAKLNKFSKYIDSVKEQIQEEYFTLPSKKTIPPHFLQRISRKSGAFTENFGNGQIRISRTDDLRCAFVAKRLATHAACHEEEAHPLLTHVPAGVSAQSSVPPSIFPYNYALYPFLTTRPLPWLMNASGTFRTRRVGEWLTGNTENVQKTGGLAQGKGQVIDLDEHKIDLKQKLLCSLPAQSIDDSRIVTASLGHLLLVPAVSKHTILPPLSEAGPLSKILNWMRESSATRLFSTSLPALLIDAPPQKQKIIHRLVYQTVPSQIMSSSRNLQFELYISLDSLSPDGRSEGIFDKPTAEHAVENLSFSHECRTGIESMVDLTMPDRPMDIRFSILDSHQIGDQAIPSELQNYNHELASFLRSPGSDTLMQPDPPLVLQHDNVDYVLRSSASVRQNAEIVTDDQPVQVITESILDLEVNEKITACKIICTDPTSEQGWESFMNNCDRLTA